MSLSRFHLPASAWRQDLLTLTGDEAAHCARVQRHQVGDLVEIGDGAGRVAVAEITHLTKGDVHLRVREVTAHAPLPYVIHLLPALIKGEAFEWLLEKAVELGAASVRPILTERSVVHLDDSQLTKKLVKWQRLMIESAKQCRSPFLPQLQAPRPLASSVRDLPAAALKIMPALSEDQQTLKRLGTPAAKEAFVMTGPEGDFTAQEEAAAQAAGFLPVTLGPLVLRAETAAIATLAILSHELRC